MTAPIRRPTADHAIQDLHLRVRALEANIPAGAGLSVIEFPILEENPVLGDNYYLGEAPIPAGAWIVEVMFQQYADFASTFDAAGLMVSDSDYPIVVGGGGAQTGSWYSGNTTLPNAFTADGGGAGSAGVTTATLGTVPDNENAWVQQDPSTEHGAGKPYPAGDTLTVLFFLHVTSPVAGTGDIRVRALLLSPTSSVAVPRQ